LGQRKVTSGKLVYNFES